jgi:hypothetical protein
MRIGYVLKLFSWSALVVLFAAGVATFIVYSRQLYPGQSVDNEALALVGDASTTPSPANSSSMRSSSSMAAKSSPSTREQRYRMLLGSST